MLINNCATLQTLYFPFHFFSAWLQMQTGEWGNQFVQSGGRERGKEMREEWKLRGLLTKGWETKEGLSAQRNAKLSPLPPLSTKTFPSQCAFSCLAFTPSPLPPYSLPASKKNQLDLWPSTIQTPRHSKSTSRLSPFSWSYSQIFSSRLPSVTWWYSPRTSRMLSDEEIKLYSAPSTPPPQEHTGGLS